MFWEPFVVVFNMRDATGGPRLASQDPAEALWDPLGVVSVLYDATGGPRHAHSDPAGTL